MTLQKLILATKNKFACMERENDFKARYQEPPIRMNLDRLTQVVACILILEHEH